MIDFPNVARVLADYADALAERYKAELTDAKRPASGELVKSVSTKVRIGDNFYAVDISLLDYWQYIEWDTRPHFPPHAPIFRWVQAKPLLPTGRVPKHRNGLSYTQEEMQDRIAWAIQHKIARDGTKGGHHLEQTLDQLNAEFIPKIQEALTLDVADASTVMIRNLFK